MKKAALLALIAVFMSFCSQEKKLLRQASTAVDNSDFDKALSYYDQAIRKNEKSFFGYAGKGIVLSEYMGRHEQAIPYLEKALENSPSDKSKPIIHGNLAQSYHFIGNYKRALQYYGKVENDPTYAEYDQFLFKRVADCKYAIEHPDVALPEYQQVVNAGGPVNTADPEYTPVKVGDELYFTSKRKDEPKEKKNGVDGKYFESVYRSKISDGIFSTPEKVKFLLPEKTVKLRKSGEAVVSASPDGKSLYIYKEGKIYTSGLSDSERKLELVDKSINFSDLQNHAALSPDGNTMYFTSEAPGGKGGSDIYYATKNNDGKWSEPVPLSNLVNTSYDEESPFVNESGILFFSSNGHPGYGGFDVYRTQKVNGEWTTPVNLGQPINSPGDDIFFTLAPNSSKGYYASARPGGAGDLDIYKVHYMNNEVPQCKPEELLTIDAAEDPNNPMKYQVRVNVPEQYRNSVKSYNWEINGKPVGTNRESFTHTFEKADNYRITSKVVAWCDSCPSLVAMCREKSVDVKSDVLASAADPKNAKSGRQKGKIAEREKSEVAAARPASRPSGPNESGTTSSAIGESDLPAGILGDAELSRISWKSGEAYFDYDDYSLKSEAKELLDANLEILKNRKKLNVIIHGYADSRGDAGYNRTLSERRARSVKEYLVSRGISSKRIQRIEAHGEEDVVNHCTDNQDCNESEHQKNRRVKIDVVNPGKSDQLTAK